jgi:C_GCAxxG_C_C family probable redox protein
MSTIDFQVLKEEAYRRARDYLVQGYNCSQSVVLTMQELLGLHDELALKAATGFGGGVGNMGNMCGAFAGGIMILGMEYGRSRLDQKEEKERTYLYCAEWLRRFTDHFHSTNCIDILGVDLKDPTLRTQYWTDSSNRERCASETVGTAARLLVEYMEEIEEEQP